MSENKNGASKKNAEKVTKKMRTQEQEQQREKKEKKAFSLKALLSDKKMRYGSLSILMTVGVIVIAILLNVGITAINNHFKLSIDMTANALFSISNRTKELVSSLDQDINIYPLYQSGKEETSVLEMLDNYRRQNPEHVHVEVKDFVADPTFVAQFGGTNTEGSIIVTNKDASKYRVLHYKDLYELEYDNQRYTYYAKSFIGEQLISNAILYVTNENSQKAYILQGHNEPDEETLKHVPALIEGQNLEPIFLPGTEIQKLTKDDLLIIVSPLVDLTTAERDTIKTFLDEGGSMLYMADAGDPKLANFEYLIGLYGLTLGHDLVVETNPDYYLQYPSLLIPYVKSHEATQALTKENIVAILPGACSVSMPTKAREDITYKRLLASTDKAYAKTDLTKGSTTQTVDDPTGEFTLAVSAEKVDGAGNVIGGKIIVMGSSSYISQNTYAEYGGNASLFAGCISYLSKNEEIITIIGKNLVSNRLDFSSTTQMYTVALIVMLIIPATVLAGGLVIFLRRRHL